MTVKAEFNAEEWSKVTEAPALAAMAVIGADRGGSLRETLSLAKAYAEARKQGAGSELLDQLVSAPPQVDPAGLGSPDQLRERIDERLREAIEILSAKATSEEVESYRQFVLGLAETVAHAHKEGGFLGIGGKEVSESEQQVLDQLAAQLGAGSG